MKWHKATLAEIVSADRGLVQTGPFGSQLHQSDYVEEGTPVVMPTDISDGRITTDGIARVSDQTVDRLARHKTKPRTIILPRRGEITKRAFVRDDQDGWLCGSGCLKIEVHETDLLPEFLYYYMALPTVGRWLEQHAVGSTMLNLSAGIVNMMPVRYPSRSAQERIADVLSTYDDLMENNRRRMALLEESARLLYREWFVRLRFPGHERTRMVHGLPEGWTRKPLAEVAEFRLGKMLDQAKNRGELLPYLANINVRWGELDLRDLREMRFEHGEIEVFGLKFGDIVMCEGGEPGRCAIWKEQMPGVMIQKAIHRIRCRENMDYVYLYHSLRHAGQSGDLATLFTGSTIKHFPREKLAKVTILVPPAELLNEFADYTHPIEDQLRVLEAANRSARTARDLLLPRLMNGEMAV
jgi:type I restriction enzyme S subunit